DQLIVDMNQNGDLTDDPVALRAVLPTDRRTASPDRMLFGPIQAPADKAIAGGRPIYFAQVYVFNRQLLSSGRTIQDSTFGQVMLKAGWYFDATVALDGLKQKVGVFDGNCNFRLGDIGRSQTFSNSGEISWYFRTGDTLLVGADGSGSFDNNQFLKDSCPFGTVLYLGGNPYKLALAPDCKSLSVEPWTEDLAEVTLRPHGDQVQNVKLAWQPPGGDWQLIRPTVAEGKVKVPPGDYRLYQCTLVAKGTPRDQIMVSGMQRVPQTPANFVAGKANTFECGTPLQIKVTATRSRGTFRGLVGEDAGDPKVDSDHMLLINASVAGAGGEVYSTFQKGENFRSQPPNPSFTIVQAG
ncbi:MAG TPA: hypothetical protein VN203_24175, partial [Candidatus Acidoferrum sp.]|nr:hypothetical protein [Candidatus Acidoferrum sp.]